jgi:hypothetical protein
MVSNKKKISGSIIAGPLMTLEDRIRRLCSQAIEADDPQELNRVLSELKLALHEHAERLRAMLSLYPIVPADLIKTDL